MRRTVTVLASTALTLLSAPAQAAAPAELGARALARGDRGRDVVRLQRVVRRLHVARLRADGAFGRRTERAVRRYERREHLTVDGQVSIGEGRGLLRRAGLPLPPRPARAGATSPPPSPAVPSGATFPVAGPVTWGDRFGSRGGRHEGVDLLSDCGTPLVALAGVRVTERGTGGAAGRYLVLTQEDGTEWIYMHLSDVVVHTGEQIPAGAAVGAVGQTGNATACHLHIEERPAPGRVGGAAAVDPEPLLRALAQAGG